ncbi:MAG: hypothetical protein WAR79_01715 [Melioribacteraceae bacterium]
MQKNFISIYLEESDISIFSSNNCSNYFMYITLLERRFNIWKNFKSINLIRIRN